MDKKSHAEFEKLLRRDRAALFKTVAGAEADLRLIAEDRESEFEERAVEERAARLYARLDDRGKEAIEGIDAALRRMWDGTYGICAGCRARIPRARLRALPATGLCADCARQRETAVGVPPEGEEAEAPRPRLLPEDLQSYSDAELTEVLRERIWVDGRIDTEELRLVCRHGVVHLAGSLPNEAEHGILMKLLTDVSGLTEVVDHLQVNELLWEREDRTKAVSREERPSWFEPLSTEDIVASSEEGIDFEPPVKPTPDEE